MTDANDRDVEDWRDDKFRVPDPPRRPDFLGGVDNMHWAQFSRKLAAQLNQDKTGFDVKLYDPSDPTQYGTDPSITPWYRLGPPSSTPDWPILLEKYGIQVLEAAGFLNHPFSFMSTKLNGRLAFESWRNPDADPDINARIHPVFARNKWDDITDHQYSLMHPALLLASAILDDPVTLSYFYALAMPASSMDTVKHVSAGLTADCKIMKIPDVLTHEQQYEAFWKLQWMTAYLENWGFDDHPFECYAYTDKVYWPDGSPRPASRPNTTKSMIRIKQAFMQILEYFDRRQYPTDKSYDSMFEEIQDMAGIPESRRADIDKMSAIYRTYLFLAQILLHELTHAFSLAYFESHESEPNEPWAPGDRCNEQGLALENFVFGGLVRPMGLRVPPISDKFHILQTVLAPFGFVTSWQWDVWLDNPEHKLWYTMDSDMKDVEEPEPDRLYPVPQAWTQWMFSDDLWTDQITRFGLAAIKVPKIEKWEVRSHFYGEMGYNKTGEERWNTGENLDDKDWQEWMPNWDEFYIDGIPEDERIYKRLFLPSLDPFRRILAIFTRLMDRLHPSSAVDRPSNHD